MDMLPGVKCKAHNRVGNRCGNWAIKGGFVCRMHGGGAPQVKAKAAERLADLRDDALSALHDRIIAEGEFLDPKVLLDTITKVTAQVELLEGRATGRTESVSNERAEQAREELVHRIDELARKRANKKVG